MAAVPSGGAASDKPILSDSGFRGEDWLQHWAHAYGARVDPLSKAAPRAERRVFSSARQVVETTFANLTESFGLKYPGAHSTWGLLMRVAAKVAAYNLGMLINRLLGRPDFALGWLVIFDQRSGLPPISERTSTTQSVTPAGRTATVVRG